MTARKTNRADGSLPKRLPMGILAGFLLAALVLIIMTSASMGFVPVSFTEAARILFVRLGGLENALAGIDPLLPVILLEVRLPRILAAALVGGGLAVSGAVFQGILLNPLADPYTLGVSAGAAFGASLAFLLNISFLGNWSVSLFAFLGAVATLAVVIHLSSSAGGLSSNNLILSGIIVAAILAAGISFLKYLADEQVAIIVFWLMGSFASQTWSNVFLVLVAVALGSTVFAFFARDLNLMSLGDRTAASLGVETRRTMLVLLVAASLIAAVCVAISGIIGFVGLLVPHMMRVLTGPDHRRLLPVCLLAVYAGLFGLFLLAAGSRETRTAADSGDGIVF